MISHGLNSSLYARSWIPKNGRMIANDSNLGGTTSALGILAEEYQVSLGPSGFGDLLASWMQVLALHCVGEFDLCLAADGI